MWRCDCGSHLNLAPGPGIAAAKSTPAMRRCGATARRWPWRAAARVAGRGLDAAGDARMGRRAHPLQARKPDADRLVQGSRHGGDAEPSLGGRASGRSTRIRRAMPARRSRPTRPPPASRAASLFRRARRAARWCRSPPRAPRSRRSPAPGRRSPRRRSPRPAAAFTPAIIGSRSLSRAPRRLAYELWEQLGFAVPDNILVPTGYGSNILGLERGFDELMRQGEVARMPRLFAVQAENCAAFAAAWDGGARIICRSAADDRRRHRHGKADADRRGAGRAAPLARRGCRGAGRPRSPRR